MARQIGFGTRQRRDRRVAAGAPGRRAATGGTGRRRLLPLLFLLIPLGFALGGIWMLVDAVHFMSVALPAEGEVVSVESHSDSDGTTYTPTIRYTAADGASHAAPTHISSSGYDYRRGARVDILYDPSRSDEVRIDGILSLWALPVGFTAIGSVVFVVLLAAMLHHARRPDAAEPDRDDTVS